MTVLRLVAFCAFVVCAATVPAHAGHGGTGTPNDVIYDLTVPWPFHHGRTQAGSDADGDGVPDARDRCPRTVRGAKVDANGCPLDSDGDGVPDGIDQCANTPRGVKVNAKGCAGDADGDGVPDGVDRCDNTPKNAKVDANGCPIDSDGDGVPDGIDTCENTPKDLAVDKKGCPIPVNEVGQKFLEGSAVAFSVQFASGKADIPAASRADLDRVGEVLTDWPTAKVEIGGHTDLQGSDAYNQKLSQQRAAAVKAYLTGKFSKVKASNLTVKGYGESKPVTSNATAEGRAKNRRVEFTLVNAAELKKNEEKMRYKKRGE